MLSRLILIAVPATISAVMLVAAQDRHPYGFYQLLRLIVCASSLWLAYVGYGHKRRHIVIPLVCTAILYNPLLPIHLDRDTWSDINQWIVLEIIAMAVVLAIYEATYKAKRLRVFLIGGIFTMALGLIGAAFIYIVYDERNQIRLAQDAKQAFSDNAQYVELSDLAFDDGEESLTTTFNLKNISDKAIWFVECGAIYNTVDGEYVKTVVLPWEYKSGMINRYNIIDGKRLDPNEILVVSEKLPHIEKPYRVIIKVTGVRFLRSSS